MRRAWVIVTAGVLLSTAAFFVTNGNFGSLQAEEGEKPKSGGLPPLVIDRDAPLLLDEKPTEKPGKKEPMADNSACFVCHGNYDEEELVLIHAKEEIDCIECHGESFAHRNDEDNVTPPDTMYWPERIESKCQECHEEHDVPAREVLTRWQKRCPQKTDFNTVVCTDCHGHHRLSKRTTRWDKKTGELIPNEKVPAPQEATGDE